MCAEQFKHLIKSIFEIDFELTSSLIQSKLERVQIFLTSLFGKPVGKGSREVGLQVRQVRLTLRLTLRSPTVFDTLFGGDARLDLFLKFLSNLKPSMFFNSIEQFYCQESDVCLAAFSLFDMMNIIEASINN